MTEPKRWYETIKWFDPAIKPAPANARIAEIQKIVERRNKIIEAERGIIR